MKLIFTSLVFAAAAVFQACTSLEKQVTYTAPIAEPDQITQSQALGDLDLLTQVVRELSPWKYTKWVKENFEKFF